MNKPVANILVVEDDLQSRDLLCTMLADWDPLITLLGSGDDLSVPLRTTPFDLILLSLDGFDADRFHLLKNLKALPGAARVPTVVFLQSVTLADTLGVFESGGTDYLEKPVQPADFKARIGSILRSRHLERMLEQANLDLENARQTAERDAKTQADFLAHMSHEIRTPMNGIFSMASLMLETPLSAEQQGYTETIHTSSESLLTILNDILDLSKIKSGKLDLENAPFTLRTSIEETLDLLAPKAAEKGIDLALDIDEGIPDRFLGDVTRLKQVLVNLLSNGVKFTSSGEVVVQVKSMMPTESRPDQAGRWHLHFLVRDTGIGIPADRLGRLFQPFTQGDTSTTRIYGGTGLGLVISRSLVENMGGTMWVESTPRQGSIFHFSVFLTESEVATSPLPPTPKCFAGVRVLVVAKHRSSRDMLLHQLRRWDMQPTALNTGEDALGLLQEGQAFDLALIESGLDDCTGLDLARQIKALASASGTRLILIAPVGHQKEESPATPQLFAASLTKPLKRGPMQDVILRILTPPVPVIPPPTAPATPVLSDQLPLRILMCDDNVLNQKVTLRLLQQMGYRANVVSNGMEAVAATERQHYDMVFMDVMMPEMGGVEATQIIRERQKTTTPHSTYAAPIVIIAMTASAMPGDRERCINAGMDDYIPKPVRPKEFRQIVERWGGTLHGIRHSPTPSRPLSTPIPGSPSLNAASSDVQTAEQEPPPPMEQPPVDLTRLRLMTDGTESGLAELVQLFFSQTESQLKQLGLALQNRSLPDVQHLAHSSAGASATCGMRPLARLLREIEFAAAKGDITGLPELLNASTNEFLRVRSFVHAQMGIDTTPPVLKQ